VEIVLCIGCFRAHFDSEQIGHLQKRIEHVFIGMVIAYGKNVAGLLLKPITVEANTSSLSFTLFTVALSTLT